MSLCQIQIIHNICWTKKLEPLLLLHLLLGISLPELKPIIIYIRNKQKKIKVPLIIESEIGSQTVAPLVLYTKSALVAPITPYIKEYTKK